MVFETLLYFALLLTGWSYMAASKVINISVTTIATFNLPDVLSYNVTKHMPIHFSVHIVVIMSA
jgi:hypothetical protein